VEGNGGSLENGAEAFMLFLRGPQLVLRSSVLTVLDLDKVNVTLENAEIFGSVLSGEGGPLAAVFSRMRASIRCPVIPTPLGFTYNLFLICVRLMMMSRMNSMLLSTAHTHTHTVSLRRRYESLFTGARVQGVSTFLHQNNSKLHFSLHGLIVFYEQAGFD